MGATELTKERQERDGKAERGIKSIKNKDYNYMETLVHNMCRFVHSPSQLFMSLTLQ